ncbi:glycosyltransferase [Lentimicrobium sp. L6]|nr:glycosyltransferase family 2 protein [Lentimicrobium sp. L6]
METYKVGGLKAVLSKSRFIILHLKESAIAYSNHKQATSYIYKQYIETETSKNLMENYLDSFSNKPLISVLMPTYNPKEEWLIEAIDSIRNQSYSNWELCIADDASTNENIISLLKKYQEEDVKINVVFRKENGHISEASNSALEIVKGEYVALLDHDDILASDALFWVVKEINDKPGVKIIYSDEDKMDEKSKYSDPYFKCDWNYSLFLSQNLVSHLGVYDTRIMKEIGGFRKGFEGSQDYDLALRFIEKIEASQIAHIPRVLYHWRLHKDSTASGIDEKPYALTSAKAALEEHIGRMKLHASVEILKNQMYRVKYHLPETSILVSIIIPTKNNFKYLRKCIPSILEKTAHVDFEILIVDNGSTDTNALKYLEEIKQYKEIKIIIDNSEFNYSAINNRAVVQSRGTYICFLNDDTEIISSNWLAEMLSIAIQDKVGAVGAKLYYSNETIQHGGVILGPGGLAVHSHKGVYRANGGYFNRAALMQEFSAVTAACMLLSKRLFKEIGGFNEKDLVVAFNDVDLCLRIREMGHRIVWTPFAELYHHESVSRGEDLEGERKERFDKEIAYMQNKWRNWIEKDPAYSPNLTLGSEDFSIVWPSRREELEEIQEQKNPNTE